MLRRDAAAALIAVLLLMNFMPMLTADDTDAHVYDEGRELDGVLFYEVAPVNKCEGFALKNYGDTTVSLENFQVKLDPYAAAKNVFDICESGVITIAPGDVAVFAKSVSAGYWFTTEIDGERDVFTYKECDPTLSGFNLDNKQGQLYLYSSGEIVDTVCYKSGSSPSGFEPVSTISWTGVPAYLGKTDDAIRRVELRDTNSSFDWIPAGNGMSSNGFSGVEKFGVDVHPFIFPDSSGKYVYQAIDGASEYIHISIYMLTSQKVVSLLCYKAEHGVDVDVLLEDKPLGYDHPESLLKALVDSGADVRFIGGNDFDRYGYVHNKYMVVDGETVVVTSENWTKGNMECADDTKQGNRGWGAVISGSGFATYVDSTYFQNDWNYGGADPKHGDITPFDKKYAGQDIKPAKILSVSSVQSYYKSIEYSSPEISDVTAQLYMSPDNTFKALTYLMSNATDRIYTEQMDVGSSYSDLENEGPLSYMRDAALRGVDARLLTTDKDASALTKTLNESTNIKASSMKNTGYATMHNKGVIIDDMVWVSSVNWTESSFIINRECGLLLSSPAVADFFAQAYDKDWSASYTGYDRTLVPDKVLDQVPAAGSPVDIVLKDKFGMKGTWTIMFKDGTTQTFCDVPLVTVPFDETVGYVEFETPDGEHSGKYVFGTMPVPDEPPVGTKEIVEIGGISAIILIILALIAKFRKH